MGSFFSSPQSTYQSPPLPDYLQNYLTKASTWLGNQVGVPGPTYPGPLTADVSPWTSAGITDISRLNAITQGMNLGGAGGGALGFLAAGGALPQNNPYLSGIVDAISGSTTDQLNRYLSDVRQRYAAMGLGTSTPLLDEESRVLGAVLPAEAGQIGNVLNQAFQFGTNAQLQAAPLAAGLPLTTAQAQINAGMIPQQTQQNLYSAQQQQFNEAINRMWEAARTGFGAAGMAAPQPVQYGQPGITSLLAGAAPFLMAPGGSVISKMLRFG